MADKIYPQFTEVVTPADGDWILLYDISANSPRLRRISVANLLAGTDGGDEDVTDPEISTFSPADDATGVATGANLVITFDEDVQEGTGNITIVATAGPTNFEVIPVGDPRVVIVGAVVTINPTGALADSTAYHVLIAATAFEDLAGNPFAGIASATVWNFVTGVMTENNNRYWGHSPDASLDSSAEILALATSGGGAGTDAPVPAGGATDNDKSFTITPSPEGYIYYSFPARYGAATTLNFNGFPSDEDLIELSEVNVTPAGGVLEAYRVFRTSFPQDQESIVIIT